MLDAAEALFARHGFRRTSVEELAERADVALSSIYANFPGGKADVYVALACRVAAAHVEQMRRVLGEPPEDFVGAVFDEYCRFHRANPLAFRLLGLVDVEPSDTVLYREGRALIGERLTGLVDEVVEAGAAEVATARRDVLMMWAGVNGLLGLRSQGFIDADEFAAMLGELRTTVTGSES